MERYERDLRQRADGSEEYDGGGDGYSKGNDDGKIDLVVRQQEENQEEEYQEGSTSKAKAGGENEDNVSEGKEEEGIMTDTETAEEEG